MLLELEQDIFTDESAQPMPILQLVCFTVEGRHDWYPTADVTAVAIAYLEENLPKEASWREYLLNASKAAAWQGEADRPQIQVTAQNLSHMIVDLGMPAVLVVENGRNDGSFLRAVFAAYAPELSIAEKNNWLHIDHSGGTGDQTALAQENANRFRCVCRVLVLKDNDAWLDYELEETVVEQWPPVGPIKHMWRRHEVENYLPDAVLARSDHPQAEDLIRHLRKMTPEQQRWIDMKKGVGNDPKRLFAGLDTQTLRVWKQGFGKRFPRPLVPPDLTLTVEDFKSLGEDVHAELAHLLKKIRLLV